MARGKVKADCRADTRGGSWAGIPKCLVDSAAHRDLSLHARAVLVELVARMNGYNNGAIAVSQRELQAAIGSTSRYIVAAIAELMEHGMLDVAAEGQWKQRQARQYRLTFVTTKTAPATNDYLRWTPPAKKSGASHGEAEGALSASQGETEPRHPASYGEAVRSEKSQKSVEPIFLPASHGASLIGEPYPVAKRSSAEGDGDTPHTAGGPRRCERCCEPFALTGRERGVPKRFCSERCRRSVEKARQRERQRREAAE